MADADLYLATRPFLRTLEALGVSYYIGGSVASSVHGLPRTTLDVDLVAAIDPQHVDTLMSELGEIYFIDREMVEEAVVRRGSFNIIHLETMIKLDVFLPDSAYDQVALQRAVQGSLSTQAGAGAMLSSAEDIVLRKLFWFRLGDETSERQWQDVLGVLQIQGETLNRTYLSTWARSLSVSDLLERAFKEVGLEGDSNE